MVRPQADPQASDTGAGPAAATATPPSRPPRGMPAQTSYVCRAFTRPSRGRGTRSYEIAPRTGFPVDRQHRHDRPERHRRPGRQERDTRHDGHGEQQRLAAQEREALAEPPPVPLLLPLRRRAVSHAARQRQLGQNLSDQRDAHRALGRGHAGHLAPVARDDLAQVRAQPPPFLQRQPQREGAEVEDAARHSPRACWVRRLDRAAMDCTRAAARAFRTRAAVAGG
ncbi:hypothetical protein [Nonomuraea diastatica]|uniref:Uncharacterized protein n=1 Tax=Nonomuraea diastatica TaxID=1848329 RepID=A0A4R4WRQ8_9ACTN|nr:hypothetical protein [Nonomuraea diastatica]TDD18790.1 hypothetical protein E1294_23175 [Nonomuraea diastatica]